MALYKSSQTIQCKVTHDIRPIHQPYTNFTPNSLYECNSSLVVLNNAKEREFTLSPIYYLIKFYTENKIQNIGILIVQNIGILIVS